MLGCQRPGMARDWHSFIRSLPQRLIAALLLWSFFAIPAASLLSAMTSEAMKCCRRSSKHDCCKRHDSGQTGTGVQIGGIPGCAKTCPSQPGTTAVTSIAVLPVPDANAPGHLEEKLVSFETRAAHAAAANSALFQRPPPTPLSL